jgi:hypothetical protein
MAALNIFFIYPNVILFGGILKEQKNMSVISGEMRNAPCPDVLWRRLVLYIIIL